MQRIISTHFKAAFLRKVEEIAHAITDSYCKMKLKIAIWNFGCKMKTLYLSVVVFARETLGRHPDGPATSRHCAGIGYPNDLVYFANVSQVQLDIQYVCLHKLLCMRYNKGTGILIC